MIIARHLSAILLAFALLLSACAAPPGPVPVVPLIALHDCQLSSPGFPINLAARCGRLAVYENRQSVTGRQIELYVAVVPAISRSPAPDPLFFLTGGPGQAATESYVQLAGAFKRVHQKRDIVLVDQRGTGRSNPLRCPETPGEQSSASGTRRQAAECAAALDADLTQYTTPIAMQDLDQVRQALGYEQINLYGLSYGTRAVQVYMKLFPERVRAVVLDGVVPLDEPLGQEVARDAQRALDLIFERCRKDAACGQAFPELETQFEALIARLEGSPVTVTLPEPSSGEQVTIEFTAAELATAVRLLSYAPETSALLPMLIDSAESHSDFSLLAAQYLVVAGQLSDSIVQGMGFSVLCAEDQPFIDLKAASQANQGTYIGNLQTDELAEICAVWPRGDLPADLRQPVQSTIPVLLLSGEADPVTPPANAGQVAGHLPNSLHIIAPGMGHNVVFRGCLPRLLTAFIEAGSPDGLDPSCAQAIQPLPFFLNPSGPVPGD